jgi:hypothetical protein
MMAADLGSTWNRASQLSDESAKKAGDTSGHLAIVTRGRSQLCTSGGSHGT